VTKLQASDGKVLGNYPVGSGPGGIAFDGQNIWVANSGDNNVTKLRASDGVVLGTYAVGKYPYYIIFDGTNIWVSNARSDTLTKLRPDGTVMGIFPTEREPTKLLFWAGNIWVVNVLAKSLSILDAATGASLGSIQINVQTSIGLGTETPLTLAFDGTYIWVAHSAIYSNNRLTKLRA
jgi:DNA-binding beta-propeller fold protein YncE